jgi:hypothetical protein
MSVVAQWIILLAIGVMSFAGRYLYNTRFRPPTGPVAGGSAQVSRSKKQETVDIWEDPEPFEPSVEDVFSVKTILSRNLELPLELVDVIIDHAEYWPHTSVIRAGEELAVRAGTGHENQFLVSRRITT